MIAVTTGMAMTGVHRSGGTITRVSIWVNATAMAYIGMVIVGKPRHRQNTSHLGSRGESPIMAIMILTAIRAKVTRTMVIKVTANHYPQTLSITKSGPVVF